MFAPGRLSALVIGVDVLCGLFRQHVLFRHHDVIANVAANSRDNSLCAPAQQPQERERQREPCEIVH